MCLAASEDVFGRPLTFLLLWRRLTDVSRRPTTSECVAVTSRDVFSTRLRRPTTSGGRPVCLTGAAHCAVLSAHCTMHSLHTSRSARTAHVPLHYALHTARSACTAHAPLHVLRAPLRALRALRSPLCCTAKGYNTATSLDSTAPGAFRCTAHAARQAATAHACELPKQQQEEGANSVSERATRQQTMVWERERQTFNCACVHAHVCVPGRVAHVCVPGRVRRGLAFQSRNVSPVRGKDAQALLKNRKMTRAYMNARRAYAHTLTYFA
jgi:hypothetical protein